MTTQSFDLLRKKFCERATVQVGALEQALATADRDLIISISHKLHGSGSIFGFAKITELAQPLEAAAESGAVQEVLRSLAEPLLAELRKTTQAV